MFTTHNCENELRENDLRVTPARLGVLAALENAKGPLDVNDIDVFLKKESIKADKVTIFRIVNALTEKGLAVPIQLNEGKLRYEHAGKADHHHLICERCGAIDDISDCSIAALEKEIHNKKQFLVKRHSLEFFGICLACSRLERQQMAGR